MLKIASRFFASNLNFQEIWFVIHLIVKIFSILEEAYQKNLETNREKCQVKQAQKRLFSTFLLEMIQKVLD